MADALTGGGMVCAPWITPDQLTCATLAAELADGWPELICEAASEILWALAGRRHGRCTATIRPCRRDLIPSGWHEWGTPWTPVLYNGEWLNVCGHQGGCGCDFVGEFVLPGVLTTVSAVTIDGDTLDAENYRIDNDGRGRMVLVRTDGNLWPVCQNIGKADDEPGTWSIVTEFGEPIPASGILGVDEFACELVKAKLDRPCDLPKRVTNLVRQGVSFTLLDPQEFMRDGKVGLYLCDQFLQAVNPNKLPMRSRAYNPDDFGPRVMQPVPTPPPPP